MKRESKHKIETTITTKPLLLYKKYPGETGS